MNTFWVSFASEDGALGVVIVDASSRDAALKSAKQIAKLPKIDEAYTIILPPDTGEIKQFGKNRFITPKELDAAFQPQQTDFTADDLENFNNDPRVQSHRTP